MSTSVLWIPSMAYFVMLNMIQFFRSYDRGFERYAIIVIAFGAFIPIGYLEIYIIISCGIYMLMMYHYNNEKQENILKSKYLKIQETLNRYKINHMKQEANTHHMKHTSHLEERNAIAQKLHDELGHTLSGSTMQLEAAIFMME